MSNEFQLRIAELMCSRVCHDLISPIGAINNGVEFLNERAEGGSGNSAELIVKCSKQALDKLSFFRAAFGVGGQEGMLQWAEIRAMLENCAVERHIKIIWNGDDGEIGKKIPKVLGKLLLNLIYLAIECLPRGGVVSVDETIINLPKTVELRIEGPKCILTDDVRSGLQPDLSVGVLSARNIVAYLAASFAASLGRSLEVTDQSTEKIVIRIS